MPAVTPRERLIVALDQGTTAENEALVQKLGGAVLFYKVNWVMLLNPGGPELLQSLLQQKKQVFLDLKIFDVPNTVREAVATATRLGVRFATVHGNKANVDAAVAGRKMAVANGARGDLQILAVTILTSLAASDVHLLYGLPQDVSLEEHVLKVTRHLVNSGCDGVIASPWEIAGIREAFPDKTLIVAPGIRLPGESTDDHKRPGHPYESIKAGADYLVVGRSIYQDADPRAKVERYVSEIERGLAGR